MRARSLSENRKLKIKNEKLKMEVEPFGQFL
jgi:hypothetical protein